MNRDLAGRFVQLFAGLAGVGLGVALMVDAGVGLSPWDVLHQGLSRQSGYAIGTIAIALGLLIFLAWIPLKQRIGVGTVINVLTIGLAVNFFLDLEFEPRGWSRYAWCVLGVLVISVSAGVYIGAGLGAGPRDGVMTGLVDRGLPLRTVRTVMELTVLAIGWALGGTVGFGTVLFALSVGPILHFVLHRVDRGNYGAPGRVEDDAGIGSAP